MSAETLVQKMTDTDDQSNLCVVLRPSDLGLEVCLVADEKGRWSIPGGHAKGTETRAQACQREVKEETGLDVEPEPLLLADHAARKLPVTLFYALADAVAEGRPGGGDVTKVQWALISELGSLNGTDRLAIHIAANRVHNLQGVVEEAVEKAESLGYGVAAVAAPPQAIPGIYLRINGKASASFAHRLSEWATSLNWPVTVIESKPYASTLDALQRASSTRRLTPVMECLLYVSDALWRYESAIAPALAQGHIVIEIGPEIDHQRLLERGLEYDIWNDLSLRVPSPTILFTVGEDFSLTEFQCLKDSIEQIKDPDDPEHYVGQLTRRQIDVPYKMEFVRDNPEQWDSPVVRCPKCKHEGPLMSDFSYLRSGMSGITAGSDDDLDAQECGMCGAKMEWNEIADRIVKI